MAPPRRSRSGRPTRSPRRCTSPTSAPGSRRGSAIARRRSARRTRRASGTAFATWSRRRGHLLQPDEIALALVRRLGRALALAHCAFVVTRPGEDQGRVIADFARGAGRARAARPGALSRDRARPSAAAGALAIARQRRGRRRAPTIVLPVVVDDEVSGGPAPPRTRSRAPRPERHAARPRGEPRGSGRQALEAGRTGQPPTPAADPWRRARSPPAGGARAGAALFARLQPGPAWTSSRRPTTDPADLDARERAATRGDRRTAPARAPAARFRVRLWRRRVRGRPPRDRRRRRATLRAPAAGTDPGGPARASSPIRTRPSRSPDDLFALVEAARSGAAGRRRGERIGDRRTSGGGRAQRFRSQAVGSSATWFSPADLEMQVRAVVGVLAAHRPDHRPLRDRGAELDRRPICRWEYTE